MTTENIDFDCARVDRDTEELVVTGEVNRGGGTVDLLPYKYITIPDYWVVDLVWDQTNALFTSITPFEARIHLASIQGIKGIILKGKYKSLTIDNTRSIE